ncbi:MAG: DUF2163 domain-containing protein [Pseudomonadota bacterium]
MKTLPPGLKAHLESGATTLCWCWKLTVADGRTLDFTDHDEALTFDGQTYEAASGLSPSEMHSSLGLAVDSMDVTGALSSAALTEEGLTAGLYDNAGVEIYRVNWADPLQRVLMRTGNLGEVNRSSLGFSAEIRGLAHQLGQPAGRLFQFACDADVGDGRCGVDLSALEFSAEGVVGEAVDKRRFSASGLSAFADGWFARGRLVFESGENAGLAMEVKVHRMTEEGVRLELWRSMPRDIAPGDRFTVTAGCDKQFATCGEKFANTLNFRGHPHMPGNDFAVSYPNSDDGVNDGGSLVR